MTQHALILKNVAHWHTGLDCTRTALCAVTGLELDVIEQALAAVATATGEAIASVESTSPKHWGSALKALGYTWQTQRERTTHPQITIDEFMATARDPADVLLILAFDDKNKQGHVFAVQGGNLVDIYTRGEVQAFKATPCEYRRFLVTYVLKLLRVQ